MFTENRCYLLSLRVVFTEVFNNNNNTNNRVTSIAVKSLQKRWPILGPIN